jgi:hypothetical protein
MRSSTSNLVKVQIAAYLDSCSVYGDSPGRILSLDYGINNNEVTTPVVNERKNSREASRASANDKYGSALR